MWWQSSYIAQINFHRFFNIKCDLPERTGRWFGQNAKRKRTVRRIRWSPGTGRSGRPVPETQRWAEWQEAALEQVWPAYSSSACRASSYRLARDRCRAGRGSRNPPGWWSCPSTPGTKEVGHVRGGWWCLGMSLQLTQLAMNGIFHSIWTPSLLTRVHNDHSVHLLGISKSHLEI